MSRFLFTCWPFTGHLLPQMAIAVALRERGHEVAFYSGGAVGSIVESEGFDFFAFDRVDQERAFRNMRAIEAGAGGAAALGCCASSGTGSWRRSPTSLRT